MKEKYQGFIWQCYEKAFKSLRSSTLPSNISEEVDRRFETVMSFWNAEEFLSAEEEARAMVQWYSEAVETESPHFDYILPIFGLIHNFNDETMSRDCCVAYNDQETLESFMSE